MSGYPDRRQRFVEESMTEAHRATLVPRVQAELGEKVGPYARDFTANGWHLPHVSDDGIVTIPEKYKNDDSLPIVAIKPGERLRLSADFTQPTQTQRQKATELLGTYAPDQVDKYLAQTALTGIAGIIMQVQRGAPGFTVGLTEKQFAYVRALAVPGLKVLGGMCVAALRPIMVLQYPGVDDGFNQTSPPTVVHESLHSSNFLNWPILSEARVSRENTQKEVAPIEYRDDYEEVLAFHFGARMARGMARAGMPIRDEDRLQIRFDKAREAGNPPDDPFRMNEALKIVMDTSRID